MTELEELVRIARKVDSILKSELEKSGITHEFAEVRIYDIKTVGVQGDERTYSFPIEINLRNKQGRIWDSEFLAKLSTKITNEVQEVNRVIYVLASE